MESESEEEEKREVCDYGEHVKQNNLRLATLAQCITKDITFTSSCKELHNWCKDSRAFSLHFEGNLLSALQAAFSVCTQDGYDLQLVSDLINTCFHARRSLSQEGALRVARWYEQLRRKRASKAAKIKRKEERERRLVEESNRINYDISLTTPSSFIDSVFLDPSEEGFHPPSLHSSMWNQAGLSSGAGPSSAPISAVPMQSPAFANQFGHMSPSYNQQRMMMGAAPPLNAPPMQPGGMYSMMSFPSGMMGPATPVSVLPPPASASSKKNSQAATQAALAAQQQQQLQMQHMHMQQLMRTPIPTNMQPIGTPRVVTLPDRPPFFVYNNGYVSPHHPIYPTLYANYQQYQQHQQHQMALMRQQQTMAAAAAGGGGAAAGALTAPSPQFGQQPAMNPQGVPIATQNAPGQMRPLNGYGAPNQSMGMGGGGMMHPMMTPGGSQSMSVPSPGAGGGGGNGPQVQRVGTPVAFGQLQQQGMQHPVICVPNPMNPMHLQQTTIMRIVACLLGPIEMPHDSKVTSFPFTISEELIKNVLSSPTLEIHIRSWSRQDNSRKIIWHTNKEQEGGYVCEIRLNGQPMQITHPNRPIVVDKNLLRMENNTLEIMEKSCVCLASFGVAIVERMSVEDAVTRIFDLSVNGDSTNGVERNKAKMREFISRESTTGQIRLPLFCSRSRQAISIPARSKDCIHSSFFDLRTTLMHSGESGIYECPICTNTFQLLDVEIDHFVGSILKETYQKRPPPLEVMLDQSCTWRMIPREESQQRFASLSHPSSLPSFSSPYGMPPLQQMQQMQQSMSFPSSFPSLAMQQQQMPLQQLQPQQMNGRKRESGGGSETGGTALKRFKSESFVSAPSGRSPAPMMAPHSVAPSMMMMGGPSTPMGGGMYGGPGSVPVMQQNPMSNMTSPYNMATGVHPSPMKEPSSHHSHVAASPMGSAMAPSTPYGSAGMGGMNGGMGGGMNQTTALTCATDGGVHVQPTSSAPYTPGSVDNKSNGMTTVTASGVGPLSNPSMRAPSAALTPDTQASTSNASAEDDGGLRDSSLSNIEDLYMSRDLNMPEYLIIVGSIEVQMAKLTEEFAIYVRNCDSSPSVPSVPPSQNNDASWADSIAVCGGVQSSA